jgi:hypothetical protein
MSKSAYTKALFYIFFATLQITGLQAQDAPFGAHARVKLDNGNTVTNSYTIPVTVFCKNAAYMILSHQPDFAEAKWMRYTEELNWNLDDNKGDGKHTVYAKFKNKDQQITEVVTDDIVLDTSPPANPTFAIDLPKIGDQKFLNTDPLALTVQIGAEEAEYFMLSNENTFHAHKWRRLKDDILDWELEPGEDGERTIFIKYMDKAKNESQVIFDKVVVDRRAPFDTHILVQNGDKYATAKDMTVELKLFAREADSMQVSLSGNFTNAEWIPYATAHTFTADTEDGTRSVFVRYKDRAGNISGTATDDIIFDTTPPQGGQVIIDANAESTSHTDKRVTLELQANGAKLMSISNNSAFRGARWQVYRPKVGNWQLDGEENGLRTVYVRFKDEAGNVSAIAKDDIRLLR